VEKWAKNGEKGQNSQPLSPRVPPWVSIQGENISKPTIFRFFLEFVFPEFLGLIHKKSRILYRTALNSEVASAGTLRRSLHCDLQISRLRPARVASSSCAFRGETSYVVYMSHRGPYKRRVTAFRRLSFLFVLACLVHLGSRKTCAEGTSLQQLLRSAAKVAVVIPMTRGQAFQRLPHTLEKWKITRPCVPGVVKSASTLSLVFNYDGDLSQSVGVKRQIQSIWNGVPSEVKSCFHSLHFLSSNLSAAETKYPIGPCLQFKRTFPMLEKLGFSHWLQFEPDVEPVRSGWGTRLIDLSEQNAACRDWWQLGSSPMYESENDGVSIEDNLGVDLHLNGNALYCLNSLAFDDYRTRVSLSFPQDGCVVADLSDSLAGYDHAWYRFRLRRENYEYMRGRHSFFRDDAFIRNFGPSSFNKESVYKLSAATMLVHSSYKFASPERKMLLDQKYLTYDLSDVVESSYEEFLSRDSTQSEKDFFCRVLQPYHSDFTSLRCVLSNLFSLCGKSKAVLEHCAKTDISYIFPSTFEAVLTARYIVSFERLPGPEAVKHLHAADHQDEGRTVQQLCSAPLRNVENPTLKNVVHHRLTAFFNSSNHVLLGSYQLQCGRQRYDRAKNVLLCELDGKVLSLQRPFRCAEDISINRIPALTC
jgi:hypothetical protein